MAAIDPELLLLRHEELAEWARRLGLAEGQQPPIAQRIGEQLQRALLQLRREIDQRVAAKDQIDAREGGALAENGQRADMLADVVDPILYREVTGDQFGR